MFTFGENFQNWVQWEGHHRRQIELSDGKAIIFVKEKHASLNMFLEHPHLST
jgi:hypothetical protein